MRGLPKGPSHSAKRKWLVNGGIVIGMIVVAALLALTGAFIVEAATQPSARNRVPDTALSPGSYDHCNSEDFSLLNYDNILQSPYQFEAPGAAIDWKHISQVSREIPRPIWFEGSLNGSGQTCPGERGQILQTVVGHNARTGEYLQVTGIIAPPQKPFPYSLFG